MHCIDDCLHAQDPLRIRTHEVPLQVGRLYSCVWFLLLVVLKPFVVGWTFGPLDGVQPAIASTRHGSERTALNSLSREQATLGKQKTNIQFGCVGNPISGTRLTNLSDDPLLLLMFPRTTLEPHASMQFSLFYGQNT